MKAKYNVLGIALMVCTVLPMALFWLDQAQFIERFTEIVRGLNSLIGGYMLLQIFFGVKSYAYKGEDLRINVIPSVALLILIQLGAIYLFAGGFFDAHWEVMSEIWWSVVTMVILYGIFINGDLRPFFVPEKKEVKEGQEYKERERTL